MSWILAKALSALNITLATQKQQQQQQQQQQRCPTIDTEDSLSTSGSAVTACLHSGNTVASSSRDELCDLDESKRENTLRMHSILDAYDCQQQRNRWSVPRSSAATDDAVSDRPGGNASCLCSHDVIQRRQLFPGNFEYHQERPQLHEQDQKDTYGRKECEQRRHSLPDNFYYIQEGPQLQQRLQKQQTRNQDGQQQQKQERLSSLSSGLSTSRRKYDSSHPLDMSD